MREENKWKEFEGEEYGIENLGRPASFLVPSHKLKTKSGEGAKTIEEDLHDFLFREFGAFTTTNVPYFGLWRDAGSRTVYDECRLYEVSFAGKERIPKLLKKLAEVAAAISEDCIYFKAGQYACLVHPKRKS